MRRAFLPIFCAMSAACGDDSSPSTTDTTDTSTSGDVTTDTTPDTTPADTTPADTTPDTAPADTTPDTTPADTSAPDVQPEPGGGICTGVFACASTCTTEQCVAICLAAADNEAEATLYTAYDTCLDTNNCLPTSPLPTPEESKASLECERTNCLAAKVDCVTGKIAGTATCAVTSQCLRGCLEEDLLCQRTCLSAAKAQAANAFFDFTLCVERECLGNVNFLTCSQQATSSIGPCSTVFNACFGDAGAAPGAAGGGGLPSAGSER